MTSKIVVNNIESDSGISSITLNSNITGKDSTQNVSGINSVTATTYYGDGSQLTGIDASSLKNGSDVKVQANASGAVVTGTLSVTHGTAFVNKHSVGVGSTTPAGRNAGNRWIQLNEKFLSVSGGTQSTFGDYTLFTFTSNGTCTVGGEGNIDILVVAGGGQGGLPAGNSNYGGGGGAGGLVWYTGINVSAGSY